MKKLGIITINDNNNYGNRLQNYALQEVLKTLGYKVETIRNVQYHDNAYSEKEVSFVKRLKRIIATLPVVNMQMHKKACREWDELIEGLQKTLERRQAFQRFNDLIDFCPKSVTCYSNNKAVDKEFYRFVSGSDQVWNATIGRATGIDFLQFATKEKRISYAASMAMDEIPKEYHKRYEAYLRGMQSISVRERNSVDLIKKEFGVDCVKVLDPTLMVDASKWAELAQKAQVSLPNRYVVLLHLGDMDSKNEELVRDYAREQQLELIYLNRAEYEKYWNCGPLEFLKILKNAEMIITDSFHVCAFSILFHRNFYIVKRIGAGASMYSRIETLLKDFALEERAMEKTNGVLTDISKEKYCEVDEILAKERKMSWDFLYKAIGQNKERER